MAEVYLSPFERVTGFSFSKKTWMLTENGEFVGVEAGDGDQTDISTIWNSPFSGMAVVNGVVYTVRFTSQLVQYYDIRTDERGNLWDIPFNSPNDCASDGTYLYISGTDTGDESSTYRVKKIEIATGNTVWSRNLGTNGGGGAIYNGGALSIAANPNGFMISSNEQVKFFDPDGDWVADGTSVVDNIFYEWGVCATRDRFWLADKDSFAVSGNARLLCYDNSGALQSITVLPLAAGQSYFPAVNESAVFCWMDSTPSITNGAVTVIPRTVTRNSAGEITGDVIDTGSSVTYDLGFEIGNIDKAAVDAATFVTF